MYLQMFNVNGDKFWDTRIDPLDQNNPRTIVESIVTQMGAELMHWDPEVNHGMFVFGPLPGLVVVTNTPAPGIKDAFEAAKILESLTRLPMAA